MCSPQFTLLFAIVAFAAALPSEKDVTGDEKVAPNSEEPQYWRAILGDICQLPSFPRATGDPQRYVECVKQSSNNEDRKDLGIWLLRECLPGYEFVASARRCKTVRSIRRQQQLCDGPNSDTYQFCPSLTTNNVQFTIRETRQAPRQCACPNGELNCVCPLPEILEPIAVPVNSKAVRRSPQMNAAPQNMPNCPCPPQQTNCVCANPQTQQPQVFQDSCCAAQQQPPCQCEPAQIPVAPSPAPVQCNCEPAKPQCACQPQIQPQAIPQQQPNCQTTTTQQQYCPQPNQQQPAVVQPQPCPLVQGGVQNARYQGICSWMIDPLATDPESRSHFLQCQPAPNNLFCGRWQRMPCAPATVFDASAQVCVWDSQTSQPGPLPTPAPFVQPATVQPAVPQQSCGCTGGVQIGSCNQNYQCPGQSVCQIGQRQQNPCMVCCYYHKKH
uniref:Chitin-binding type-2 domain-containing protein n=1 Tax=Steinernema glaseri TaxID=37863 RepID=A0A1I7Y3R0_9BILA